MKIKTDELTGDALDWVVAVCENTLDDRYPGGKVAFFRAVRAANGRRYSERWGQGGPIIDREKISLIHFQGTGRWRASVYTPNEDRVAVDGHGPTSLIAAMRCYVASKLGDEVDVPEELLK